MAWKLASPVNTGAEMPFHSVNEAYTENSSGKTANTANPMTGSATKTSAVRCSLRCKVERRLMVATCLSDPGCLVGLVQVLLHLGLLFLQVFGRRLLAVQDGLDVLEKLVVPFGAVGVVGGKRPAVLLDDVQEFLLVLRLGGGILDPVLGHVDQVGDLHSCIHQGLLC